MRRTWWKRRRVRRTLAVGANRLIHAIITERLVIGRKKASTSFGSGLKVQKNELCTNFGGWLFAPRINYWWHVVSDRLWEKCDALFGRYDDKAKYMVEEANDDDVEHGGFRSMHTSRTQHGNHCPYLQNVRRSPGNRYSSTNMMIRAIRAIQSTTQWCFHFRLLYLQ